MLGPGSEEVFGQELDNAAKSQSPPGRLIPNNVVQESSAHIRDGIFLLQFCTAVGGETCLSLPVFTPSVNPLVDLLAALRKNY